jgi:hypothetical protein
VRASPDERWIPAKRGFLFPVRGLSVVFRGKLPRGAPTGLRGTTARLRRGDHRARRAFGFPGVLGVFVYSVYGRKNLDFHRQRNKIKVVHSFYNLWI